MAVIFEARKVTNLVPTVYNMKDLQGTYRYTEFVSGDRLGLYESGNFYVQNYQVKDVVDREISRIKIPDQTKRYLVCFDIHSQHYLQPVYDVTDKRVLVNLWYTLGAIKETDATYLGSLLCFDEMNKPLAVSTRTGLHNVLEAKQKSGIMVGDGKPTPYGSQLFLQLFLDLSQRVATEYVMENFKAEPYSKATKLNTAELVNIIKKKDSTKKEAKEGAVTATVVVDPKEKWLLSDLIRHGGDVMCPELVEVIDDVHTLPLYVHRVLIGDGGIVIECKNTYSRGDLVDALGHEQFTVVLLMR